MAIGQRYYTPNPFEITPTGVPYAAARLFFYLTNTATPLDTYQDVNLTVPNPNPVVADANGRFGSIFLSPTQAYLVQFWTPATTDDPVGAQIWSEDPVGPAAGGAVSNIAGIIGEVRMFAGPSGSIPSGWYLCYGQAVSRATYSVAFALFGTTYGVGDGTTTFNLPDLRGRMLAGLDNMGGTPANRVTAGISGIAGNTLGSPGGDQRVQTHTHTVNDPGHMHTVTDAGHVHGEQVGQPTGSGSVNGWLIQNATAVVAAGVNTANATTGVTIDTATTGITNATSGAGNSQNMPPAMVMNSIIYLGV